MRLGSFDFSLPPGQIARFPLERGEEARLLVLEKETGAISHRGMSELPELLDGRHHLVLNESKVIPTTLKTGKGGSVAFGRDLESRRWKPLGRSGDVASSGRAGHLDVPESARKHLKAMVSVDAHDVPEHLLTKGRVTYPSYLAHLRKEHPQGVPEFYNNAYARHPGSVALPSGGINLTVELLEALEAKGIGRSKLTLHVGHVTFRRPTSQELGAHRMEGEAFAIEADQSQALLRAREAGKKLVAVGTTCTRTLEYLGQRGGLSDQGHRGVADLFIKPGHQFALVDGLLTGFHGPKTTLFMLVCALGGIEQVHRAYQEALERGYRWYTLGDSMLII